MSELREAVEQSLEARAGDRMNNTIALLVALTATVLALANIKDGNVVQAMSVARSEAVNAWAHYQAKSLKQALAQASLDQLELQAELGEARPEVRAKLAAKTGVYRGLVERYEVEKNEIKQRAEGFEREYERLNVTDDQFDMSEAFLSLALALYGVTALTRRRWLLWMSVIVASIGAGHAAAAFAGVNYRPEWFAKIFG